MACNTLSLASSSSASAVSRGPLSSASASFMASSAPAMIAPPCCPAANHIKPLVATCSLSDKDVPASSSRNPILTALVATGAALSVFTASTAAPPPALAFSGPGGSGAERTAQKAQDLLKSADKLNVEDAPQRYGPGRISGSAQDAGKVAQDAGGKAISQIQGGVSGIFSSIKEGFQGLKDNVESKNADAKKTLDEAASNVQKTVQ
ncbi:hypothetical protein L7F22_017949 [Adiantum nelumboides]|nr:hypothetical protein [Adiantum nelumboides]